MFLVTKTKFDDSFPKVQVLIEGLALLTNMIETLKYKTNYLYSIVIIQ